MMTFGSIRLHLQVWYGVMLVAVLTGFGVIAYQLESSKQTSRLDEELEARVTVIMSALRPPGVRNRGPMGPGGGDRDGGPPPFGEGERRRPMRDEFPGESFRGPPREGEERREGGGPPPAPQIRLSPQQANLFDEGGTNAYYYIIWWRTGDQVAQSDSAPSGVMFPSKSDKSPRTRGIYREAFHFTPPGECVLVGRSIQNDLAELHRLGWLLTGAGATVLVLGLVGGGWLTSRALRPIDAISATAVKIAAGDLSQRINTADAENELGRLTGVLNSTFDRLEAAFSQQGRFTSDAAHELRTPVSVILTQTQGALSRDRTAVEFRKTVEVCQRAAQRMRRLIDSLLELARLDAGEEQLKRLRFDLAENVRDCIGLLAPLTEQKRIAFHVTLPPTPCDGDPERLAQVITNLLTNAIEYNVEGGEIWAELRRESGLIVFRIRNTGEAILPEDLPRIFDRFYRADKARSGSSGRNGLGLAICKAIITAHGGNIEASSDPQKGTTFTVRLPVASGGRG